MQDRTLQTALRRLTGVSLFAVSVALAAPAMSQAISYPPSRSLSDIAAWLQRDTPISPGQVVDLSPSAITAVTSAQPTGQPRGFLANVSSEALDPEILGREGITAWSIPVEVDCEKRAVRLGLMTGYRSRDLKTDPHIVRQADTSWVNPTMTAPLGSVIRALCDRDFKRPLAGGKTRLASAKAPPEPTRAKPAPPSPPAGPPPIISAGADDAPKVTAPATPPLRPALTPEPAPPAPATMPAPTTKSAETKAPAVKAAPVKEASAKPAPAKPAPAKVEAPKGGGPVVVQIGASPNPKDVEALLAKFKKAHAGDLGGLSPSVATAQVDGKTVNRALISGFATKAEANTFCKSLEASGQACFIRR
jgi:cell division septation protein DedD